MTERRRITGFSNETLIFDAGWSSGGERHEGTYVVRVAPTGYTLFPDATFDTQHRALRLIAEHTSIPVPQVRWLEEDPAVLGAPFFVMVNPDLPARTLADLVRLARETPGGLDYGTSGAGGINHFMAQLMDPLAAMMQSLGNPQVMPELKQTIVDGVMREAAGPMAGMNIPGMPKLF